VLKPDQEPSDMVHVLKVKCAAANNCLYPEISARIELLELFENCLARSDTDFQWTQSAVGPSRLSFQEDGSVIHVHLVFPTDLNVRLREEQGHI
jgi:hypothetical protein